MGIQQFFTKINCKWLLKNFPFPTNFPQKSVIGFLLINFTLNGLEKISIPTKKIIFDQKKFNFYVKQGFVYHKNSLKIKKSVINFFVRYNNDFVVISNDQIK